MDKFGRLSLIMAVFPLLLLAGCGSGANSTSSGARAASFRSGGIYPEGVGVDANNDIWVANRYSNKVVQLSNSGGIIGTFQVGLRPHGLKIDRANTGNIWVENTGGGGPGAPSSCPNATHGTVTELTGTGVLVGTFCTGGDGPQHADFDGHGNVWVSNQGSGTISELATADGHIERVQPVGETPHAIALDASGNPWVGNYYNNTTAQFQLATNTVIPFTLSGTEPTGNAFDAAGNLWQSVQSIDQVAKVDPTQNPAGPFPSFDVGVGSRGVTIDKADNVFVANQRTNDVYQLNASGDLLKTFKVGSCPENMAIDAQGNLWVSNACSNSVSKLKRVATPFTNRDGDSNG
ncbi:MAG: hypothetical protein ACREQ4_13415 [Candidatus Binataceae bacterium]